MKIAIYSTEKLQRIDAGSYFLEVKKNCPSMLKTNQVTTVYVWKKHASMTRFI